MKELARSDIILVGISLKPRPHLTTASAFLKR